MGIAQAVAQSEREEFSLHLPTNNLSNGQTNGKQAKAGRGKGIRPQRYSKDQMISLIDAEKSRHLPNDLVEWTIELGINGAGSVLGQHGASLENGESAGQGDDLDGQTEEERRVCPGCGPVCLLRV